MDTQEYADYLRRQGDAEGRTVSMTEATELVWGSSGRGNPNAVRVVERLAAAGHATIRQVGKARRTVTFHLSPEGSVMTVNPAVDHLDPANWWPSYDLWSDRRAIPAHCLLVLDTAMNITAWAWLGINREPGYPSDDGWRAISDVDQRPDASIILDLGNFMYITVAPDTFVYITQTDFDRLRPEILAALKPTFDALWAHHQAGRISRSGFDVKAADLRGYRDRLNKQENPDG